jgi:hypothetical protein
MSLTYGVSELSSKNYGAFIRPRGVFNGYYSNKFYTGGTAAGVASADHKSKIIRGMFLDLPIASGTVEDQDDLTLNQINIVDTTGSKKTFAMESLGDGSVGDVVVIFAQSGGSFFEVTDNGSKTFTSNGDSQGVVCYSPDGTNWYIYDVTFIPVGVAQEQPKIASDKGEEISDSYSNKLTTSYNTSVETVIAQVTKNNIDFLNTLAESEIDFGLYEHSSRGNSNSDGMLISTGSTAGGGWMVKEINIVPKLLISGNAQNTITLSADKEFGVSVSGTVGVNTYITVA